jgi:CHAT domain-containing protein
MRNSRLSLFLATALLAAAGTTPVRAANGDLGNDVAGEACRLTDMTDQAADILCGPSPVPAGRLHIVADAALPAAEPARRAAIASAVRTIASKATDAMTCDGGKTLDANTVLFVCTLGGLNWPHVVLASATAHGLFLADGLPGMIPALETAISAQSGTALAASEAATTAVRAAYPAGVIGAGARDYSGFLQLSDAGARQSAAHDFAASEASYRAALDVETRLFGPNSAAVGGTLLELAVQISNQQRFDEAAALFRRAAPIIQSAPSPEIRARFASYRGLDAANQRDYAAALQYARQDTANRQAAVNAVLAGGLDLNGNPPVVSSLLDGELANALHFEAEMEVRTGDTASAQASAEQALYIVTKHPDLPLSWRVDMVSLMGEINAREGRVAIAERDFNDTLTMDKKLFGDGGPTIMAELQLGSFYSDQELYSSAVPPFRAAFAALAKDPLTRSQLTPDQITPFLAASAALLGDAAQRNQLEAEMFAASQISDSGVAAQTIARMAARRAAETPALAEQVRAADDAARTRDELRMSLAAEHAKTDDERNAAREQKLAADLAAASDSSDALFAKLYRDFPAYAGLADPGAVTLDAMKRALRPHEAFVSYVIGVHASYVLLVTHDGLTVRPVPITGPQLATDIAELRSAFSARLGRLPDFSLTTAAALYKALLGPVAPQLAGMDHLVVAASGDLASLPFSLLVTSDPGQSRDYTQASWLVRQMAVSEIPSARAFMALRSAPAKPQPRPFLGIGNPSFSGGDATPGLAANALASSCQLDGPTDPALLRSLQPLPDTAVEVQTIATDLKAAPEDILLGADATESAVRARPLDQYGVLYFATHGMLPGELHCQAQPGLVLSPPLIPATTTSQDGLLTASEISGLRLNAGLVVLSACNTAATGGTRFGGGALEGLADAFFNAGAHAVLASHWEVPSTATTSLMTGMFDTLSRDQAHDVAEALRQAQLSLIAQSATAHPFDWAAFTLIGDGA